MWNEKDHPRDNIGRFTEKYKQAEQIYNTVGSNKLVNNDLTNKKSNDIIQLSKSEYSIVRKQIFEKQINATRRKKKLPKTMFISTANNCYLVSVDGDNFSILQAYDIEKDWDKLKELRNLLWD